MTIIIIQHHDQNHHQHNIFLYNTVKGIILQNKLRVVALVIGIYTVIVALLLRYCLFIAVVFVLLLLLLLNFPYRYEGYRNTNPDLHQI